MDSDSDVLQKKKLELEIKELARPYYARPAVWISAASLLFALVGVIGQSYLSSIESARVELEIAQSRADAQKYRNQIEELNKTLTDLKSTELDLLQFISLVTSKENIRYFDEDVDWKKLIEQIMGIRSGKRKQALLISLLYAWKEIPFSLGGKSLRVGFDSPGFLKRVLADVGVVFNNPNGSRLSDAMIAQMKTTNTPQAGDIAFYRGQVGNFGLLILGKDMKKGIYVGIGTLQESNPLQVINLDKINTRKYPLVGYFSVIYPDEIEMDQRRKTEQG